MRRRGGSPNESAISAATKPVGTSSASSPVIPQETTMAVVITGASGKPEATANREIAHAGRALVAAGEMGFAGRLGVEGGDSQAAENPTAASTTA